MNLSDNDVKLFYTLRHPFLYFAGQKTGIIQPHVSLAEYLTLPKEEVVMIREKVHSDPSLIDTFIQANPYHFGKEELQLVLSWKRAVKDRFFVAELRKDCAVFLDDSKPCKAYGVIGLKSPFEEVLPFFPCYVQAILLPFKGQIIYDGILQPFNITFGGGMRESFKKRVREAENRYGIIKSLDQPIEQKTRGDEEQLLFYMANEQSREQYTGEIEKLRKKDTLLDSLYHRELGRIASRSLRKQLTSVGLNDVWVATIDGIVVATALSQEGLEMFLNQLLPKENRQHVHLFKIN